MAAKTLTPTDPPVLLAGAIAARKGGDRMLAQVFLRELRERFGIDVRFAVETRVKERQQVDGE